MMEINENIDRSKFAVLVVNELKKLGVKYHKDKKNRSIKGKIQEKRIFGTQLHLLELTDAILASGNVVQIPRFVVDACARILEQVEMEGIFRKAGSSVRQREIRSNLEAGFPLGKSHHVIDVANVVKSFFRELPEPLIPPIFHQTLLRSLLLKENSVKAIQLICLLLPPLMMNTLSFFMQFLYTVSLSSRLNKMSVENLAIIFTPGLMPFGDINNQRFKNHVKILQLLIENANEIGKIPECIAEKIQIREVLSKITTKSQSCEALETIQKKPKKRRSEMFNGLRKIVSSAIDITENMGNTLENKPSSTVLSSSNKVQLLNVPLLSCSPKRRRIMEQFNAFSAKKEQKKTRASLEAYQHVRNATVNTTLVATDRRWSIVGSGWLRNKDKNIEKRNCDPNTVHNGIISSSLQYCSTVNVLPKAVQETKLLENECVMNASDDCNATDRDVVCSDYMRVPKQEYEIIKERVNAIENQISKEFETLRHSRRPVLHLGKTNPTFDGIRQVESKYRKVVEDTGSFSCPSTEYLAQQLRRDLRIRRSEETRVIRSPSARKIGSIRRRSQEKAGSFRNGLRQYTQESITNNRSFTFLPPFPISQTKCSHHVNAKYDELLREISKSDHLHSTKRQFNYKLTEECKNNKITISPNIVSNTSMLPLKTKVVIKMQTPTSTSTKLNGLNKITCVPSPFEEGATGRESIARLRTQNAGMVMAKAKLFDRLNVKNSAQGHQSRHLPTGSIPNNKVSTCKQESSAILKRKLPIKFPPPIIKVACEGIKKA